MSGPLTGTSPRNDKVLPPPPPPPSSSILPPQHETSSAKGGHLKLCVSNDEDDIYFNPMNKTCDTHNKEESSSSDDNDDDGDEVRGDGDNSGQMGGDTPNLQQHVDDDVEILKKREALESEYTMLRAKRAKEMEIQAKPGFKYTVYGTRPPHRGW